LEKFAQVINEVGKRNFTNSYQTVKELKKQQELLNCIKALMRLIFCQLRKSSDQKPPHKSSLALLRKVPKQENT